MGLPAARIELRHQQLERAGGLPGSVEIGVQDVGAPEADLHGARLVFHQRDLPLEDVHQRRPLLVLFVDAGQRLQRRHVAGDDVEQGLPGALGAPLVLQVRLAQLRQAAQVLGVLLGIAGQPLDLRVEHARQIDVALEAAVDAAERVQGAGVVRIDARDLLPVVGGARGVVQRGVEDLGGAGQHLDPLVG